MKTKLMLLAASLLVGCGAMATGSMPPVEIFFKDAEFTSFKISPNGKSLAMLAPYEGKLNLYTYDLENRVPRVLTGEKLDVDWFVWANDNRILYTLNQGVAGRDEQRFAGGIFAIDKDGKNHDCLIEPVAARGRGVVANFMHRLDDDEDHILVSYNERRRERPDVYRMNVNTGALAKVFNNPARINGYAVDECGVPRFGFSFSDEAVLSQYYRLTGSEEWIQTVKDAEDYEMFSPAYIPCDSDTGYVVSNVSRDKRALFRMDFKETKMSGKPILEDDVFDVEESGKSGAFGITQAIGNYFGNGVVGFRYEGEKPMQVFYEETHRKIQEIIDNALPGAYNAVTSHSDDGNRLVILSVSNMRAPAYYLLSLDTMEFELLARTRPWLESHEFCGHEPVSYEARDGRIIHGYLTLPKSYRPGSPVPLIINPHGGPWARDEWGFWWFLDLEQEFYASRGFAVLRVNFRGSTGYGKDHLTSSFKNMEAMHHDVIDGVLWAVREGYADRDRIGIAGASWGGYATMTALVKNPELFRFGINMFGVVDFIDHINRYNQWDRESAYQYWLSRIGDPKIPEDRENLEQWSPINFLENMDDPVFVYHGLRDYLVDIEQSRMLIRKLKSLDKDFTEVIRIEEGHSAADEENRIALYREIDSFLERVTAQW